MDSITKVVVCLLVTALFVLPISAVKNEVIHTETKNALSSMQTSGAEWSKTYGGDGFDMLHCVQEADDGGYIACGITQVDNYPNPGDVIYRPWVLKVDFNGDEMWDWTLEEIEYEGNYFNYFGDCYCTFVQQTSDGGYIACFGVYCTNEAEEYWICGLAKLDESGEEEWVEHYAVWREWSFHSRSVMELDEGGFIATGLSGNYGVDADYYSCLMKTDTTGKEQWHKEYNYGDGDDETWAVCSTDDGGYLLTGWATTDENATDYWMIKTDGDGNKQWDKTFGGYSADYGHSRNCYQTDDGGYIMAGYSYSFGAGRADVWIVKTDSTGNMAWNKTYGDRYMDVCWSMASTDDDGYVSCITKNINSAGGDQDDIQLVKTDSDGNVEWVQEFGGSGRQVGQYISRTSDGGFIVSGRTGKYQSSSSDGLLVKFGPFENERPNKPDKPYGPTSGKPGTEYTFSSSTSDSDGDSVYYMWDWGDGNFSVLGPYSSGDTCEASYTWTGEANYNIRVMAKDENSGESDWSDPLAFSTPKAYQPFWATLLETFWMLFEYLLFGIQ